MRDSLQQMQPGGAECTRRRGSGGGEKPRPRERAPHDFADARLVAQDLGSLHSDIPGKLDCIMPHAAP